MSAPQTLGSRIAQARREKSVRDRRDVTAVEMAKAVGVTPTSVSEWETDKKAPREPALAKLAAFLGVTPAFLRYGVVDPMADLMAGARKLTEAELDRADAIVARDEASKARKPTAKRRRA